MATCQCGCGQETKLAPETDKSKGWVKGVPLRFVRGHARRSVLKYPLSTSSPEYRAWWAMIDRCENPKNKAYPRYGGRGIAVVGKMRTFPGFIEVVGRRPSLLLSLDRRNNDGNYEAGNVRWATRHQQRMNQRKPARKKRGTKMLTADQIEKVRVDLAAGLSIRKVAKKYGVSRWPINVVIRDFGVLRARISFAQ